ncbi:hypothetical protein CO540_18355 [Micromonospora sp. WMMA2032]|uniref:hypothetical protein n=1 Tax=Micromonospora sp. WMMA2032 TaxID=2039870 RepID=UPI000C05C64E|nr:hypothetical protein [Micromonospora sp. WMMA2032]ATO15559.1 hypothetical protein CO540_18355 [Micromonospora sp. WMMA2032]
MDDHAVESYEHGDQHEVFRSLPFPFTDDRFPDQLGAVVQRTVLEGVEPAREVIHTDDNAWIVGDGVNDPNEPDAVVVTCIQHVAERDPAVAGLAGLPLGQVAYREDLGQPWSVEAHSWLAE